MRRMKGLFGNGTVTPADGHMVNVTYNLSIFEDEISDGSGGKGFGLMRIVGTIKPFCGAPEELLTLHMNDRHIVQFCFTDMKGSVTATGEITSPPSPSGKLPIFFW